MPGSADSFTLSGAAELATILAVFGAVTAIYKGAQAKLRATVFSRRDARRRLDRMACGVTSDYVDSLFRPPPFRFSKPLDKAGSGPDAAPLTERIYQTRHA